MAERELRPHIETYPGGLEVLDTRSWYCPHERCERSRPHTGPGGLDPAGNLLVGISNGLPLQGSTEWNLFRHLKEAHSEEVVGVTLHVRVHGQMPDWYGRLDQWVQFQ